MATLSLSRLLEWNSKRTSMKTYMFFFGPDLLALLWKCEKLPGFSCARTPKKELCSFAFKVVLRYDLEAKRIYASNINKHIERKRYSFQKKEGGKKTPLVRLLGVLCFFPLGATGEDQKATSALQKALSLEEQLMSLRSNLQAGLPRRG